MVDIAERLQCLGERLSAGSGKTVEISYADILQGAAAINALVKALQDIIDENDEFRKAMPADWDGDPLEDACTAAKAVLVAVGGPTRP